ncbi:PadR family transcriptional regulator [Micromonospora globbae]|jgi:DNA-binding PadR family transcriptional regulator|uniref:PadR family transcriptional regulator n=1 Tax=Micromonospora globbae TaxID=1894969 RepID=A0A420EN28_9ACTN|nr:PadR family transcriptional regulator [Micromonospora globbae]RKF22061.1 PadR family transcriptional regulator [Micromonospora globbae]
MPLRATDNPLVVPLLGLLLEQPRHQYALLTALRERYRHLRVRTGSVYTLIRSLEEVGWIEPIRPGAGDNAPVAYQLTPDGIDQFRGKVVTGLQDTEHADATAFVTALAYIGILDRSTARAILGKRLDALRRRVDDLERAIHDADVAPVQMIEVAFSASQTRHDIDWLEHFRRQIADPDYAWPVDDGNEP